MSNFFNLGDYVKIHGQQNQIWFTGETGIIVQHTERELIGIDFSRTGFSSSYLHDLGGMLPRPTGYYLQTKFLTKTSKTKTGFGKFIERIENGF